MSFTAKDTAVHVDWTAPLEQVKQAGKELEAAKASAPPK